MNKQITAVLGLKKGREQSLARRHPWVFSGAVGKVEGQPEDGDLVELRDASGAFLGIGHYQAASIMVRILSREDRAIDSAFYEQRIGAALKRRDFLGPDTDIYRLVHGDGDLLPGLVIDCYGGVLVVQAHSAGMARDALAITEALTRVYGSELVAVYLKESDRRFKAGSEYSYLAPGIDAEGLSGGRVCREAGHSFHVNWEQGQKTGFFIDQRDNRRLVAQHSKGRRVLNTFCYSGGFSVYALAAGAEKVVSVDSSRSALDLAAVNSRLLGEGVPGVDARHELVCADIMGFLKDSAADYELIVLDPPAYAKHVKHRHRAIQAYKRLNALAMSKLLPGGLLFSFSCSQVVTPELFEGAVRAAGLESGREVRILQRMGHPQDHPVSLYHPEGEYLKGLLLQVD